MSTENNFTPSADSRQLSIFGSDAHDARPLPEIIASGGSGWFEFPLQYHDVDGSRYYAVQDWIAGVAQPVGHPGDYWKDLLMRATKAGIELSASCVKLKYRASDGKNYKVDFEDAETLYTITRRMGRGTGIRCLILGESTRAPDTNGYVYVLHFEQFPNEYKIGIAVNLENRMSGYRTENPPSAIMIVDCTFYYADCRAVEKELHAALKEYQLRGEWFNLTADQIPTIKQWLASKNTDIATGARLLTSGGR